jgi:hypothetical protein
VTSLSHAMVIATGEGDEDDRAAAMRRAAEALQPSQDAMKAIAASMLPQQDAMKRIAGSMLSHQDAMQQIAASMLPQRDAMKRIADSMQPSQDALKRIAEAMQPSQDAVRRMAELIQPNRDAMRHIADSLQIDPATIEAVNRQLSGGFHWQADALAMSVGQAATFTRAAAEASQGEAADALADLESALSDEDGDQTGTLYDWFRDLALLAQDRVVLAAIKSVTQVVLMGYAEADAHPPFHIGFMIVVLLAIAEMGNAKSD